MCKEPQLLITAYANIYFVIIHQVAFILLERSGKKINTKATITIGKNVMKKIVFKYFTMVYLCRNR